MAVYVPLFKSLVLKFFQGVCKVKTIFMIIPLLAFTTVLAFVQMV